MNYTDENIIIIKRQNAKELGMDIVEYEGRFEEEERLLIERIHKKKDKIYHIIKILENSEDFVLEIMGGYIRKNTENLLSKH